MAASSRIFALDLGTQTIALAEFRTGGDGGLILVNYRSTELLADPAADATRQSQTRIAVGEMVAAMGIKGQSVQYAIASQSVFTRFVKLPSVGEEQVDQIVGFEAQQNVPYPINEVVWDFQLVETNDKSQVEVVIVAIKSDLLDEINHAVEDSGVKSSIIDVSPMALFNAYRYNYSDQVGCSLVIDIGARTTNLIFVEPRKVFSRSIPTGGNTITAAIAKDSNDSFGGAEELKKQRGFVSLGGAYADPDDPEAARISKITRNTMTRLHAEIVRSISFYRSQQGGTQPVRVFLAGGTASMPYMREFFQEKFQMPVEFFNAMRNVAVGGSLNAEEMGHRAHTLGGIVGLALRGAVSCPMELNLRPAGVIRRERQARQRPALIVATLAVLVALAAWWLYLQQSAQVTAKVTQELQPKVAGLQGLEGKMEGVRNQIKKQEELAGPLLNSVRERDYWTGILNDINARMPSEYVWITSFEPVVEKVTPPRPAPGVKPTPVPRGAPSAPETTTVVQINGLYLKNDRGPAVVDDFVQKLQESELYKVDMDPTKLIRATETETEWAYSYSFELDLKNPISIVNNLPIKR
jgi:type IV pilus assembly protein PilM